MLFWQVLLWKAMLVWSKILHRNSTLYLKWSIRIVLFEWANPGIFLFIFVLFTLKLFRQLYNLNCINWKNQRVSNPRPAGWKVLIIPLSYGVRSWSKPYTSGIVQAKWGYDRYKRRCVPFYHSSCGGGNNNVFESKASCEEICPTVYPPIITVSGKTDSKK